MNVNVVKEPVVSLDCGLNDRSFERHLIHRVSGNAIRGAVTQSPGMAGWREDGSGTDDTWCNLGRQYMLDATSVAYRRRRKIWPTVELDSGVARSVA